jgi:hypothetical protein
MNNELLHFERRWAFETALPLGGVYLGDEAGSVAWQAVGVLL